MERAKWANLATHPRSQLLFAMYLFTIVWGIDAALPGHATGKTFTSLSVVGDSAVMASSSASYSAIAQFSDGTRKTLANQVQWAESSPFAVLDPTGVLTTQLVNKVEAIIISARYTYGRSSKLASKKVMILPLSFAKSINSTSRNRNTFPADAVPEQTPVNQNGFSIFAVNDLGMHCGDLDHPIVSILPPFNVLHTQVL